MPSSKWCSLNEKCLEGRGYGCCGGARAWVLWGCQAWAEPDSFSQVIVEKAHCTGIGKGFLERVTQELAFSWRLVSVGGCCGLTLAVEGSLRGELLVWWIISLYLPLKHCKRQNKVFLGLWWMKVHGNLKALLNRYWFTTPRCFDQTLWSDLTALHSGMILFLCSQWLFLSRTKTVLHFVRGTGWLCLELSAVETACHSAVQGTKCHRCLALAGWDGCGRRAPALTQPQGMPSKDWLYTSEATWNNSDRFNCTNALFLWKNLGMNFKKAAERHSWKL